MKRIVIFSLLFFSGLVFSDEPSRSLWDYHPLHVGGNAIFLANADVTSQKEAQGGHLAFRKENVYSYMLLPINEKSYFFPRIEWNAFTLNWNKNPKFNETHFNYLQFGLTFYTIAIEKWRWIMRADYNLDTKHFSKPALYGLTTGLLWGAYEIHRKWHYHVGTTFYVGMEGSTVYPLIGADYSPNKKWTFIAIFPINYAIQYQATDWCRLSLKGRPLKERFRTGKYEPQPRSVFNYTSMGLELNSFFQYKKRLEVELYGGYNFRGNFYIKDRHGHNALYTNVGGSPYIGLNVDFAI